MAHSHYVIDLYYQDAKGRDGFRREALRIDVADDEAAIAEGKRVDEWRKTDFYQIRAIRSSTRSGDKVIYSSRPEPTDAASPPSASV